ncbi:hypothetical protein V6N11_051301 [Hibiscus sabdariffa]|uniref:Uncharacterized protein n=1 Tax=Hibiscus sabdariffa TaxID=183260 RepID=A0ABR2ADU3_9ROSI
MGWKRRRVPLLDSYNLSEIPSLTNLLLKYLEGDDDKVFDELPEQVFCWYLRLPKDFEGVDPLLRVSSRPSCLRCCDQNFIMDNVPVGEDISK